jgi:hypothetical protein
MDNAMNTRTTRMLAPAILFGAITAMTVQPAIAQDAITLAAGLGCDFKLSFEAVGGKLHTKTFVDKKGNPVRTLTAGKGVDLTYTNVKTGESVTIKTAGSVTSTVFNPDGTQTVTSTGHNGLILFPTDVPAGPSTVHYVGRFVYTVNPKTGVFTLDSEGTTGTQRDICAELS